MPTAKPDWYEGGLEHLWLPYTQMKVAPLPLPAVRSYGSRIVLADGRELVDGIASWWTACHGYNHPHIAEAVRKQLEVLPHVMMGGIVQEQAATLAQRLAAMLPGDLSRVFFSDSGSVAVEVALKTAVQYWLNRGQTRRTKFITFRGAYHGDTTGAMSVSDLDEGMHQAFRGLTIEHLAAELPRTEKEAIVFEQFVARHAHEVAGIIVEPLVQGAGGMIFHEPEVLRRLRKVADNAGALLIFDEIFTGFARTGTMFAAESANVAPDIMTLSKALTGGTLPLAATIATKQVFDAFWSSDPAKALMHGPTFMGNALACAAANASLDLFEREPRLEQVAAISAALARGLEPCRGLSHVKDVRVRGAIGVVELDGIADLHALRQAFIAEGVFVRPFGSVVYLAPAFTIGEEDLKRLTDTVVKVVKRL